MRYEVSGANRDTGQPVQIVIEASSPEDAEQQANGLNIMVSKVIAHAEIVQTASQPVVPQVVRPYPTTSAPVANIAITPQRSNSLGIAALILGILAFLLCWIPFVSCVTLPLSALGALLGVIGLIVAISRRGYGIGLPVAGILICSLAFGVAMITGVGLMASTSQAIDAMSSELVAPHKTNPKARIEGQSAAALPPSWFPIDSRIVVGDVAIEFISAVVEKPSIIDMFGDSTIGDDEELVVTLRIHNVSESQKFDFKTWRGADFSFSSDYATMADDSGNSYRRVSYSSSSYPEGGVKSSASIYPGEAIEDVLIFQRLVDSAEYLELTLPCGNFDEDGRIVLRIPAGQIKSPSED